MTRDQLIKEIGQRINDTVPEDRELTEEDIEALNDIDLSVDNILEQTDDDEDPDV